jgi:cold shock CspA family protein
VQESEKTGDYMDSTAERLIGEVTSSKPDRGFCFVQIDDGSSFFLHFKNVKDRVVARPADQLSFLVRETPNRPGFVEAYDAILVERASKAVRS